MLQAIAISGIESNMSNLEPSDAVLLSEYASTRNPTLFSELARRYTGSVYGTCLRITSSVHDAEEVTQDCFFELAKQATSIHTSVAGWLHRMATNRSLNLIRSKKRRLKHEVAGDTEVSAATGREVTDPTWSDLAPILDEVINTLPEELREPVVQHYLNGDSQLQIAEQLDLNQSTVSRRIQQALETLRSQLQQRGVTLGLSSLLMLMSENSAEASPELVQSVSKIGLLGVGGKAAGSTATTLLGWIKLSALLATPALLQIVIGGWSALVSILMLLYITVYKPDWFIQHIVGLGGRAEYFTDFPVFERWTWETPPPHARRVMKQGFALFGVCLLVASVFLFTDNSAMRFAGAAGPLVLGLWRFAVSVRLMKRLPRNQSSTNEEPAEEFDPITLVDLVQVVGCVISGLLFAAWSVVMGTATEQNFFFWYAVLMGLGVAWGLYEFVYKYGLYTVAQAQEAPSKTITEDIAQSSAATAKRFVGLACFLMGGAVFLITLTILSPEIFSTTSDAMPMIGVVGPVCVYFLSMAMKPLSTLRAKTEYQSTAKTLTRYWIACGVATVVIVASWALVCFR